MIDDVIAELGLLCLGSRLKRLGERLQADTARFIEGTGLSIQPPHYPLLAALDRHDALTVGELADALGVSQPGVTRNLTRLVELGLVAIHRGEHDQRRRTVALTKTGVRLMERSKRDVWPHVEAAVAEICKGLKGPLLGQLTAIEDALEERPLDVRAGRRAAS